MVVPSDLFEALGDDKPVTEEGQGLYDYQYKRFRENREGHDGYDFQQAPVGNIAPPRLTFGEKLRWWTWDRWKRRRKLLAERDRLQREILDIPKERPIP